MGYLLSILPLIVIGILILITRSIRIIKEYERGVILTLGKYSYTLKPGLKIVIPIIQQLIKVDMRLRAVDIPRQEVITKDNVTIGVNAVVYFKVEKAEDAVLKVEDYTYAVSQYALAALRDVIGGVELDTLLSERERVSSEIKRIVDEETSSWGVDVVSIKIQDIELPAAMKRAMAAQAEAEREKRAIIAKSEGEIVAAENLKKAAEILSSVPGALSLRTLEAIEKIQPDPSKTVIFALPVEILEGLKSIFNSRHNS